MVEFDREDVRAVEGLKFGRKKSLNYFCEVKRETKHIFFYFSDFVGHAAAWFGHAAACHENLIFEKAWHVAA